MLGDGVGVSDGLGETDTLGVGVGVGRCDSDGDAMTMGSASQHSVSSLQPHVLFGWHTPRSHASNVLTHGLLTHLPNSFCGLRRTHAHVQLGNVC